MGVIHDARLYTVQALKALAPGSLDSDIYFKYGSQDSLTLFSLFYRPLLASFGIAVGHAIAALLGQVVWCAGAFLLLSHLFANRRLLIAVSIAVVLLPAGYGASGVFSYAENFATPRIFAEGLVLAATGCALRARWGAALALLAASAALHPIMGLTGLGLAFVYAALSRPVLWLIGASAAACLLLLTVGHVGPFARLAQAYDPRWFSIIRSSTPYLFLSGWRGEDWLRLAAKLGLCVAAVCIADRQERRALFAVLALSGLGLALTLIGADLLRNIFVVETQPWRVLWLLTVAANIGAALLILRLPRHFASREALIVAVILSVLGNFVYVWLTPEIIGLIGVAALGVELWLDRRLPMPVVVVIRTWSVLAFGVAALMTGALSALPNFWPSVARALLAGAALVAICQPVKLGQGRSLLIAGATLVATIALWDSRSEWEKFIESPRIGPDLAAFDPRNRRIYWEQGLELQWIKLREPGYYSCLQRVGTMLSRDNALDYNRRTLALRNLNTQDFGRADSDICPMQADPKREGPANMAAFQAVCASLPDLDAVILLRPIPGGHPTIWEAPAPLMQMAERKPLKVTLFYRYSCDHRFA